MSITSVRNGPEIISVTLQPRTASSSSATERPRNAKRGYSQISNSRGSSGLRTVENVAKRVKIVTSNPAPERQEQPPLFIATVKKKPYRTLLQNVCNATFCISVMNHYDDLFEELGNLQPTTPEEGLAEHETAREWLVEYNHIQMCNYTVAWHGIIGFTEPPPVSYLGTPAERTLIPIGENVKTDTPTPN